MPGRLAPRTTARLVGVALAGLLTAGAVAVVASSPAHATPRPGATGLHDRMMPTDAPDAPSSGVAQPNTTLGGSAPLAAGGATQTGVDVARYQHPNGAAIDWNQVAASGQRFAIVKATELYTDTDTGQPVLYSNPYLAQDLNGARAAGLVIGAYAFAHPENSAITQADVFASVMGTLPSGSLPPVLDLEVNGGLSPAQLVSWTQTFLTRLKANTNVVPMIYSGPSFWGSSMGGSTAFTSYPLWEAHYTAAAAPYAMGGWPTYSLWQFTSSATVPGITAAVDQNRFDGGSLTALAQHVLPSTVDAGSTLAPGMSIVSPDQQYALAMQGDGNLVVYGNGAALWSSGTSGHPGAYLVVQQDGNAVVYTPGGQALWASWTSYGGPGGRLAMQDDGNLVMIVAARALWYTGAPKSDTLFAGGVLKSGQYIHDAASASYAIMQGDGNFVVYRNGVARFSTGTFRYPGSYLVLQSDGNLVVYDGGGVARWSSATYGSGAHDVLIMQADGNLVLYNGARALWARGR